MAINQILPFGSAAGANVLDPQAYENLDARSGGFVNGVARSREVNTPLRQASFVAAALAQYIVEHAGLDVLDDGDVPALVRKLVAALAASPAFTGTPTSPTPPLADRSERIATTAFVDAAIDGRQATVDQKGVAKLATAALAAGFSNDDTIITPRKLADAFASGNQVRAENGLQKLPGGLILQWGRATATAAGGVVTFPLPFPSALFNVQATAINGDTTGEGVELFSLSRFNFGFAHLSNNSQSAGSICWLAIGH